MFFTNDPWQGALHANDGILVMPIFAEGELVGWSGIVTHDQDVGSPAPGSFVTGAHDRFGEAPLFPAIRMARDFELLPDVERAYLRNSRTPSNNALNMRARVAGLRMTHERIAAIVEQYGQEAFLAAQEGILAYVERVLRARLREIPDGSWFAKSYIDHDGISPAIHPICCRVVKQGERLVFDMTGTAPQALGPVNCARPAMEGAVLGVIMISLCYDLPWAIGALRNVVEIVSEEGTINNAKSPAAVSMASVMGTVTTMDVAAAAFAKLLQSSEENVGEAQATWAAGVQGGMFIAIGPDGVPAVSALMDPFGGGGGARTFGDGVDTGGIAQSMASRIANVEVLESRAPMLQVYRRQLPDSGGPGRYRGGVTLEYGGISHKAELPPLYQTVASGVQVPGGRGLSGGFPGAAGSSTVLRGSDIAELFAAGRVPIGADELEAAAVDVQEAKAFTMLEPGDFVVGVLSGGAGVGDPLRREPAAVATDVARGLVSTEIARSVYGVLLADGEVDVAATEAERENRRRARLAEGQIPAGTAPAGPAPGGRVLHPVGDAIEAAEVDGRRIIRCTVCSERLSAYEEDYKPATSMRELAFADTVPMNSSCSDDYVQREFSCPGCGTALTVDVQRRDEPVQDECRFGGL